eukprot:CAMPEP_0115009504 /NCGR_PEP_ID=MMETSP0216-20121206/22662_1 /TAXON_ID=223996 /ORGANISM="Protocruzia adherens, Strain Boccale" /LENGTH=168 /DNA_ID=CAMNT_0002377345 /DNA_START=431 /DNA_END=937 /DNA_ORIENTATION=+
MGFLIFIAKREWDNLSRGLPNADHVATVGIWTRSIVVISHVVAGVILFSAHSKEISEYCFDMCDLELQEGNYASTFKVLQVLIIVASLGLSGKIFCGLNIAWALVVLDLVIGRAALALGVYPIYDDEFEDTVKQNTLELVLLEFIILCTTCFAVKTGQKTPSLAEPSI